MKEDFRKATNLTQDYLRLMPVVQDLAREAGDLLMRYYGKNYSVTIKEDDSPVTSADMESSRLLVRGLEGATRFPVVSEENDFDPEKEGVDSYWAIDPLDGTKEFIGHTGGFCVKIALIEQAQPTLGVVYCPVQKVLYAAFQGGEAYKTDRNNMMQVLQTAPLAGRTRLRTLFNQKHADPAQYERFRMQAVDLGVKIPARPAIKPGLPRSLRVAEGLSDIHVGSGHGPGPKAGSGYVWDAAADHLILRLAGGGLVNLWDGQAMTYPAARERMPAYLAYGDPALHARLYP